MGPAHNDVLPDCNPFPFVFAFSATVAVLGPTLLACGSRISAPLPSHGASP